MTARKPKDPIFALLATNEVPDWGAGTSQEPVLSEAELIEPCPARTTPERPDWMAVDNFAELMASGPVPVRDPFEEMMEKARKSPPTGNRLRGTPPPEATGEPS